MSQQQQQTIIRAAAAPVKETLVSSTSRFFSFGKKDDSNKRRISSSVSSATLAKDANSTTTLSSTQSGQTSNKTRNTPARPRTPKLGPKKKSASPVVHMATPPAQTGNGVSSGSRTLSTESPYIDLPENFVESTGFSLDEDFASILNNQKFASSPRSPGKAASARLQSLLRRRPSRATMRSFVTGSSPASSPRMQRQDGGSHNRQPSGSMLASSPPEGESLWTTSASSPLYRADIPNMPTELLDTVRILSSESGAGLDEPIDLDYADLTLTVDNSRRHRMAGWDDDGEDEITKLKYELARATQRIVELEAQAKSAHGSDDAANLDAKIEERRQTIASLEAQRTVMQTEVEVLQDHNPNTPKTHQATSSLADETEKLSRMKAELESAKKVLQTEIEELIAQRNGLLEENARLMKLRDAATVESEHLNTKNLQLSNMNDEITRQIQDKFKNNKVSHSPAPSDSSAFSAAGRGASRHKNEGSADYSPSMSSGKIPLFSRHKDTSSASGVAPPTNDEKAKSPLVQSSGGPIVDEVPEVVVAEETVHLAKPITIISTSTSSSSPLTRNRSGSGSASNSSAPTMVHSISSREINQGNSNGGGGGLKFWKRKRGPGAAVAKGFNKMFTNESGGHQGGVGGLQGFAYNSNGSMSSFEETEQHEQQPQQQQYLQPPQQNSTGGLGISLPKSASAMSALNVMAGNGGNGKHSATSKLRGMAMKVSGNGGGGSSEELAEANGQPKLFGMDISERAAMEGRKIPMIITRCIEEVEVRGMDYEGIYRKSGIKSQITAIQLLFERAPSEVWDLSEAEMNQLVREKPVEDKDKKLSQWDLVIRWYQELTEAMAQDICGVTSVLKQYLRYIPNPIITFDSYLAFVNLIDIDDVEGRIYSMTQIVKSLPSAHQRCLEVLVRHLARVVESSDKNLMTSRNLAVVFAPTLVRDYSGSREIMDANKKGIVVQFMIDHAQRVFGDEGLLV
ncbi:hypothetical protein BZA70DRAFT_282098 [Myxozyma melibiosi]|uniref:Rho-GAP domain-containing protein n=1 Tax=Myxozyma melibiosi TaxID=54550 RepID=A0ABR1F1S3_9ASCO